METNTNISLSNDETLDSWLVVGASIIGKSHKESAPAKPCQDRHGFRSLNRGWGVAVVCDGAGSQEHSSYAAEFLVNQALSSFGQIVEENGWQHALSLPDQAQWHEISKRAFAKMRHDLEGYAKENRFDSSSLGCTIIVVVYASHGILATHIGDGRAAFCNERNEWKALMKPQKGEEANQTVFMTSVDWNDPDAYIESTVFNEKPLAFTLLSDGCEAHSFEVNIWDAQDQKFKDPNKPYPKFFAPLVETLKRFHQDQVSQEEMDAKWQRFIESGTEGLKNEPDGKTMILGVRIDGLQARMPAPHH